MYELNTYESIRKRMLEMMLYDIDKREGSFTNNMVSPVAIEFAKAYIEFDNILNMAFLESGYDNFLDRKVSEFGLDRKTGDKAKGLVRFYGDNGTFINTGIILLSSNNLRYRTIDSGTISSEGHIDILVEAENIGTSYNVDIGGINQLQNDVYGVSNVENVVEITGGLNVETDNELKHRFKETIRKPATSGNIYDYEQWATSVEGVGYARIEPLWKGPGTVRVIITDSNNNPVGDEVKMNCKTYIDSVRPIGADVTVDTPTAVNIAFSAILELEEGYLVDDVVESFKLAITESFTGNSTEITYTKVMAILSNTPGVNDFSNLQINGIMGNIPILSGTVPRVSDVIFSEGDVE